MNMTRRQAATIIGLLFSIFVIVGIASYRESGQAQDAGPNRVYVPVVSGVNALAVSSEAEESPIVADVPVEEDKPFGETLPPEVLAQMREEALKMAAEMQIIPASGPETMGFTITVTGKDIKLPNDVYIEAEVITGLCVSIPGKSCGDMPMPIYALRYRDSDVSISISQQNGKMASYASTNEARAQSIAAFQWLADAIESEE